MTVDDRLRRGLGEVPPADPSGAYERIVEKRVRRRIVRRTESVALAILVVAGSAAGFLALSSAFRPTTQPASSPMANGRIVFAAGEHPNYDIYSVEPDGSDLRNLTETPGVEEVYPDVSPDGTLIAFCRYTKGGDDVANDGIWTMTMDGSDAVQLRALGNDYCYPTWSPDQERLALQGHDGLFVMNADGSDLHRITIGSDWYPAWSPDGDWIAFHRQDESDLARGRADLFIVHPDGSGQRRLTSGDDSFMDPKWSPDSEELVFMGGTPGDAPGISILDVASGEIRSVATAAGGFGGREPFWSPDGTRIGLWNSTGIVTLALDGSDAIVVYRHGSPYSNLHPSWQPVPPSGVPISPSSLATETPTPANAPGEDIGLAFNLCDVQTLQHVDFLGDGTDGTAWTGAPLTESARCPIGRPNSYVVAVDLDGEDHADDMWQTIENCFMCQPYAATDLDGDGDDELVVLTSGGTTPRYDFFDIRPSGSGERLEPIRIAEPGDAEAGFSAGDIAGVSAGGDEGFSGYVACRVTADRPEIVVGWADGPVDGPGSDVRQVHMATLVVVDGLLHVVSSDNFERLAGDALPYPFGTDNRGCGVDWDLL